MTAHYYDPNGQTGYNKQAGTYFPHYVHEIIRLTRRELAHRYGSRGTTKQLHIAVQILEETRNADTL